MEWSFKYSKKTEKKEKNTSDALIKIIKDSQYYSKRFLDKDLPVPENRIVKKKKHKNRDLTEAILVTEHSNPDYKKQFILFWVPYREVNAECCFPGIMQHRIINLTEKIPTIHDTDYWSVEDCSAANEDVENGWAIVGKYLPEFKEAVDKLRANIEKEKDAPKEQTEQPVEEEKSSCSFQ